jgi:hypothetical protein
VRYTQPTADASVPKQTVEYILGEARAFVFAVPANGGPSISAGAGTTAGPTTGGTGTSARPSGGVSSSTASNTGSQTAAAAPAAQETNPVSIVHRKPSYLVWLYLIWQTLVVCTGGALLWWRRMELARA